ncbi:uncharacterized protein Veneno isoform X2 [Drosophila takahashii]|uniref:uncharacterized protein Veneno isoform X2 n=1 Tax=Drosophila takahashii TaxID=29030 RepID=UPI003898D812
MPPKKAVADVQIANGKGNCVLCAVAAERICQRCGDFYCSKDCQLKDWPRHRYICFPLPALVYPKSFSVYQSTDELSLEGACSLNPDKTWVESSPAPISSLLPDLDRNKICNTGNIAPINKVPILPSPSTPIIPNNSGYKPKNKLVTPPNTIMPPSNSLVYIMGFKSANRCFIRDASESAARAFAQVCEKVNTMGNEMPRMVKPRPFGFCLALHNGTFHRAKVINVFGNHSARLFLLDQGVVKSRTISELREINEELFSLPCYSLLVQLKDVPNYAVGDEVFAFTSQFAGEIYSAIREKTPGCVQVELLHTKTKISVNAKIREFFAKKEVSENQKNVTPIVRNPPIGQQSTKNNQIIANPVVKNSQAESQTPEIVAQELIKKLEAEVMNPGDDLSFPDKNKEKTNQKSPTTGQESLKGNAEITNNDPAKVESGLNKIQAEVTGKNDQIQGAVVATAEETFKKDDQSDIFGQFFRSYANNMGMSEQDITKMNPREIFSEFLRSHANIKDTKDTPAAEPLKPVDLESKNTEPKTKDSISKDFLEAATKDETNGLEIALVDEEASKVEKPTTADQEIKSATETLSKPTDEEVKQFLTQCLPLKTIPVPYEKQTAADNVIKNTPEPLSKSKDEEVKDISLKVPLELPKLKEKLDSLPIAKTNSQTNGIGMAKYEPLLNPPFELRRFSIDNKEGINVFVVDSSKKDRGIFGAFDSTYATEFSTLHSRLSEITDSEPYKPVVKEYVLARFEGSWYRGRVEQIINNPHQQTMYRVMYVDYTNVEDITIMDIRRYPLDFTSPCTTNLCVIDEFPHKPNAAQIAFLSDALKVHKLVHVDSVNYLNNIAIIKSRSLIQKLMSL